IRDGDKLLTHCNAGALAVLDWGTALAPMRVAKESGKKIFVFVDETRPRLQGAKLTAWELDQEGIDHAIIADNAAGFYMSRKEVDMVIVGADRIGSNGDFANKIGTYEKAVVAKENGIPFYVAAPASTFDFNIKSGEEIPIEERDPEEVLSINGVHHTPLNSKAMNPAFDVTPSRYVTGYITEYGIFKSEQFKKLKEKIDFDLFMRV
ncbi:translation initiation factor, aIF-2BI family, partial [mine drainage metagenome]